MGRKRSISPLLSADSDLIDDATGGMPPEVCLLLAVVERALCDLSDEELHIRRRARGWLMSDVVRPFSLVWTLDQAGCTHVIDTIRSKIAAGVKFHKSRFRDV